MADYTIHTDGGARGNPGPAGAGAVIADAQGRVLQEISKFLGHQTNNFAEYEAVACALEELKKLVPKPRRKDTTVEVKMDSELIARQLSGVYQVKEPTLFPQFIRVHNLIVSEFPKIIFTHVRREQNSHADRLANEAMDHGEAHG